MNALDQVTALRRRLWDMRYRPIAVYNWNARVRSPGKQPDGEAWQIRALRNPPDAAARDAEPRLLNTGILCSGLRAIDIDFPDFDEAAALRDLAVKIFGNTIIRTRGNSGKLLMLYRAAVGEPPKRVISTTRDRKVEVLGAGQQFVAYGTHETRVPLEWHNGSPETTPYDFLEEVTEQQIDEYFAAVKLLHPEAKERDAKRPRLQVKPGLPPDEHVAAVLAAVPAMFSENDPRHYTMVDVMYDDLAPMVKSGHLDEALAIEVCTAGMVSAGREPRPGEVEEVLYWCIHTAKVAPYEPPTYGEEFDAVPPLPEKHGLGIDRRQPMTTAGWLATHQFMHKHGRTLHRHRGDFWHWLGSHYRVLSDETIRQRTYHFLANGTVAGKTEPYHPDQAAVTRVVDALKAEVHLTDDQEIPSWIGGNLKAASEIIAAANGLLHIPTRELLPHTPRFFSTFALPYAYDPAASHPAQWLKFLADVLPNDTDAVSALQEMFGLMLTADTRYQKIWLLIGPKRAGKGTIARVLKAMLGAENTAAPTLDGLATNFGLEPLIGKHLAIVGDARLGNRTNGSALVERLLSVSGEDGLTIDRKHRESWTGTLPTRFLLLTNEMPRLDDASGALASRFIIIKLRRSFHGQEDTALSDRLLTELPGILNWALAGLDRLRERGRLAQPASGHDAVEELERLSSPIGAFLADCCVLGPDEVVGRDELYAAYTAWMAEQGWQHAQTKGLFGRDLSAAVPGLGTARSRVGGKPAPRKYMGVGLRQWDDADTTTTGADLDDLVRP